MGVGQSTGNLRDDRSGRHLVERSVLEHLLPQIDAFDELGDEVKDLAVVPGIDDATFREKANAAKVGCPVSKALSAVPITLEAALRAE